MDLLVALDSFKGSLTAAQACELAARALAAAGPGCRAHCLPMADGGEGTAAALAAAAGGELVQVTGVSGPRPGQRLTAAYAWLPAGPTAVVEMAQASGLTLIPPAQRDPFVTTTRGTGELLAEARRRGARRLLLTLGGSATHDGGTGAAAAGGWRFLDRHGRDLPPGAAGLRHLARIVPPAQPFPGVPVDALCDVTNPLCGPRGAAAVYALQKGAAPEQLPALDAALGRLAECLREDLGLDLADQPGTGAAGGFGAGAIAFFGARLVRGVDAVMAASDLAARAGTADWVITGEGCLDSQSLQGKVVSGVLAVARRLGRPVAVLAGRVTLEAEAWEAAGIRMVEAAAPPDLEPAVAMAEAAARLSAAARRLAARLAALNPS